MSPMSPLRAYAISMSPPRWPSGCPVCGSPLKVGSRGRRRIYCSANCQQKAMRDRVNALRRRVCEQCGGVVDGHGAKKFCSHDCYLRATREKRRPAPATGCRAGDHGACELDEHHGACSECGRTVRVTRTSAPPGRRRCRECRAANPKNPRRLPFAPQEAACPTCAAKFTQQRYGQKYCRVECRPPRPGTRTAGRVAASRRRRLRVATTWDGVTDAEILERDRWMCGICRKRIGKTFQYPHTRSASIDHVVPLSQGGDDTAANKRAAHLSCNVQRSNRGGNEQLALVG
jgi:hypothetical protein